MPRPAANAFAHHWRLDPAVTFLNHGSFGACPAAVLDAQTRLRAAMEANPMDFLAWRLAERMAEARAAMAAFLRADPAGLLFVPNATTAVNAVLQSHAFQPGDEILLTDHGYHACFQAARRVAETRGARLVTAALPFPISGPDVVVERVLAAVTPRTRLALLDHVTSPTALVLPVETLVAELQRRGVDCLVDGAHALGMLDLDLGALGAAYYTANAHKWFCAPKGAAVLHVRQDRRRGLLPPVLSHAYERTEDDPARLTELFDWTGTFDPTAWLALPETLRIVGSLLPGGWPELRARNHALALRMRDTLCARLGVEPPAPDAMLGSMAAVPLPSDPPGAVVSARGPHPLQVALARAERIEVPIISFPAPPKKLARVSAQLYNTPEQAETLAEALKRRQG